MPCSWLSRVCVIGASPEVVISIHPPLWTSTGHEYVWPCWSLYTAINVLAIRSPVVALGFGIGPAAISFPIPAVGVDPIERCARRSFAHIRLESCERIPSPRDRDSPTAVVFVG